MRHESASVWSTSDDASCAPLPQLLARATWWTVDQLRCDRQQRRQQFGRDRRHVSSFSIVTKEAPAQTKCPKAKRRARDHARVQGTNDSSILSKVSMATAGYVQDQLLAHFICEAQRQRRRSPLINRGYYIRAKAVDYVLTCFLERTRAEPRTQMVSLGAGFDTAYFRLKSEARLGRAVVFEVDFPAVARRKATLIRQSPELLALLSPGRVRFNEAESGDETPKPGDPSLPKGLCVSSADYCLLGVDVTQLRELEESLVGTGFDPAAPTLLLSECVLTYVDANRASALIGWAAERLVAATFVAYEQAHPGDGFGSVMMNHFSRLGSPLRALRRFPTRHAQHARYLSQERARVEHLELFDEHEEWHLKCSHYFILVASKGRLSSEPVLPPPSGFVSSEEERELPVLSLSPCEAALALPPSYGHRSCTLGPPAGRAALLTLGGFGPRHGRHGRLTGAWLLVPPGAVVTKDFGPKWDGRMYPSLTATSAHEAVLFGGRRSPARPCADVWLARLGGDAGSAAPSLALSEVPCIGAAPSPRWRHAACVVSCRGRRFLFVYGGRDTQHLVLSDWHFLDLEAFTWTQLPVSGSRPEGRHSHAACGFGEGAVVAGGLGAALVPLGCVHLLSPAAQHEGFTWRQLPLRHPITPRYSHTAHVIEERRLVLVGGVGIHSAYPPALAIVDLLTGSTQEYNVDTCGVEGPVLLHGHSAVERWDSGGGCGGGGDGKDHERHIFIVGGGGNCFSFGTHLNPRPLILRLPPNPQDDTQDAEIA
ncbi:tRNA wybutosine-synthesizing protein 4 isoform X2 [Petromyzon marinus]|uniref:tRNA wybutosine-synthesizing protein 4 isoform X2 n=1 Tax=Petromyzon marinus TaxID=7757 RepID=UPI003F717806